jgi:hypothetical protein
LRAFAFCSDFFAEVAVYVGVSESDEPEYDDDVIVPDGAAADGEVAGDFGQRGLRPVPQVGAGVGACVVLVGVGVGLVAVGDGLVVFFGGAAVVAGGFAGAVVWRGWPPPWLFGKLYVGCGTPGASALRVGAGGTVAVAVGFGGCVEGRAVSPGGVGLSLTLTLRRSWSSPPNVDGTTESSPAWRPMIASRPVAAVASITMKTLDSSGPRCALLRVTAATSPELVRTLGFLVHLSATSSTDCTCVVTLCHQR